jgi:methylase of polypeptide subunit release factors
VNSPQEDTWFLTDTLVKYFDNLDRFNYKKLHVCEIGLGSGYISAVLGKIYPNINFVGVDVYFGAVELSYKNMIRWIQLNRFSLICSNLLNPFNPETFQPDVIYFNPPYVKTSIDEYKNTTTPIIKTWAGGPSGTAVIHKFLENLKDFNFKTGFFVSSQFNDNEIFEIEFKKNFRFKIIDERKVEDEKLLCYQVILRK